MCSKGSSPDACASTPCREDMRAGLPASRLLRRLEEASGRACRGGTLPVLAFSGGLSSTLLAALLRKRGELRCIVAGLDGAADLEAARLTETYLDYRVERIRLTPRTSLSIARDLGRRAARLSPGAVLDLVPIAAVLERTKAPRVIVGAGHEGTRVALEAIQEPRRLRFPIPVASGDRTPSRRDLQACADLLGIPETFSRARRRPPARGSGVREGLETVAADEGVPLARLVHSRDYH